MNLPRSADFSPQEATPAKERPCGLKPVLLTGSWPSRMASGPRGLSMHTRSFLTRALALLCLAGAAHAVPFPRSAPEAQGIQSGAVLAFVEAANRQIDSLHSLMLVRHGHVVAEGWWRPYNPNSPHELYSLSKSFTSTAVGLAIGEGKLSLDDGVLKFFPDEAPATVDNNLKAMRVRDLLCMSTGQQKEARAFPGDQLTVKRFLAEPVTFKPGTHFLYNTPATYMLSAIVQKVTGQRVVDYLRPRLFEPLGIDNPLWPASNEGITLGGYGLSIRTEDIARFGQLYLRRGTWEGRQLVPAAWIDQATARQTSNGSNPGSDWDQGYGFQFWRCRHGAYRGDGAFGQYCVVLPAQDTVVAITGGLRDMQAVLNLVWDMLLPGIADQPLPDNAASHAELKRVLAGLTLPLPPGEPSSPVAAELAGKTFEFPPNEQKVETIRFEPGAASDSLTLRIRIGGQERRIACGAGDWRQGRLAWGGAEERAVAIAAAWPQQDTLTVRACFYETPFVATLTFRRAGTELWYDSEVNVSFGATRQPRLTGKQR